MVDNSVETKKEDTNTTITMMYPRLFCFRLGSLALILLLLCCCCSLFSSTAVGIGSASSLVLEEEEEVTVENPTVQVRLTLHQNNLRQVPSCQHSFSKMEITNMVRAFVNCVVAAAASFNVLRMDAAGFMLLLLDSFSIV